MTQQPRQPQPRASPAEWTLLGLIRWTTGFFEEHGLDTPRLDAELLLAHVLGMGRMDLYLAFDQPVSAADRSSFRELVRRRAKERVPVAYLSGVREFWSLPIRVRPGVLIPRAETETLVRVAAALRPVRIAELGVGSGCVSAALLTELPEAEIVAFDACEKALEVARENLETLGIARRIRLECRDRLADLEAGFDLIVSNPPYIPSAQLEGLPPEIGHEPRLALDGGPDGLSVIRQIVAEAPAVLTRPGCVALEVGAGQAPAVEAALRGAGADEVEISKDLAGIERVVRASFQKG